MNANNIRILSDNDIMALAPSVMASNPAPHTSPNYQFANTKEAIDILRSNGWGVASVTGQKARTPEKKLYGKHVVQLVPSFFDVQALELGGVIPTLNMINSHDWSSGLKITYGFLRLVCSNGMIVAGATFQEYAISHNKVREGMETILARFQSTAAMIQEFCYRWQAIKMADYAIMEYAKEAANLRFGIETATENHARVLLTTRRREDEGNTLWNVFNVVQENSIKGGIRSYGIRKTRGLTNIQTSHDLNQDLFELTEKYAEHMM